MLRSHRSAACLRCFALAVPSTLNGVLARSSNPATGYTCKTNNICFTFASTGAKSTSATNYWLATSASENLTWTNFEAGQPVPTNAVTIGSWLVARSVENPARSCHGKSSDQCPTCCRQNVIPGYVVPAAAGHGMATALGPINYED